MDDRHFDSITKALATGKNRRSILKGLLGLGGAVALGGSALEQNASAARRPTPAPKPVSCPGRQTMQSGVCTCPPDAPNKCGPDCCTGNVSDPYPRSPSHTECCDNACCDGTCYGEERCCPTNMRPGELPPTHIVCEERHGLVCVEGNCCNDSDCGDPCQICNQYTHTCEARCDGQTEVCCQAMGGTVCIEGSTCPVSCSDNGDCQECEYCDAGFCANSCIGETRCCNGACLPNYSECKTPCEQTCADLECGMVGACDCGTCESGLQCASNMCVDPCITACADIACGSVGTCDCSDTCGAEEECQGNVCVSTCLGINDLGCTAAVHCCANLFCEGGGRCCVPRTGACRSDADCCTSSTCLNTGVCS